MKIFAVIMCVLAVTVVYGNCLIAYAPTLMRDFNDHLMKCNAETGSSPSKPHINSFKCAMVRYAATLYKRSENIKDLILKSLMDFTSDKVKLERTRATYIRCHNDVMTSEITGDKQAAIATRCHKPIMSILDKAE
ncbi:uncharacterized protein LOC105186859 [Harpegnathos saltator]|uniref:uncharacterized protein LOC105186859 n=1 Tax=Harpegnathos saltator TaxID=610380 RepID=UPI00058EC25B|nr:uncharacterized protein LOC105186859 [Harpegnathos saltator]